MTEEDADQDAAFSSLPAIFVGALMLAVAFAALQMMAEVVLGGAFGPTTATWGLAGVAFWGYVLVGLRHRRNPPSQRK